MKFKIKGILLFKHLTFEEMANNLVKKMHRLFFNFSYIGTGYR